jgi:LuxR family quorum-sensing system transcriptional regulator CciR
MAQADGSGNQGLFLSALPLRMRAPLADACAAPNLQDELRTIAQGMGFVGLSYFARFAPASRELPPGVMWSTHGCNWETYYRVHALARSDPRLEQPEFLTPMLWDYAVCSIAPSALPFLEAARNSGLGSGVVVNIPDARHGRIVVALDGTDAPLNPRDVEHILENLGDVMLFATVLHDQVLRPRLLATAPASSLLSPREHVCLTLAARGLTSEDIAQKLGITARTANFHVHNIIRKLGALNRSEAISIGMRHGMIDDGLRP